MVPGLSPPYTADRPQDRSVKGESIIWVFFSVFFSFKQISFWNLARLESPELGLLSILQKSSFGG